MGLQTFSFTLFSNDSVLQIRWGKVCVSVGEIRPQVAIDCCREVSSTQLYSTSLRFLHPQHQISKTVCLN